MARRLILTRPEPESRALAEDLALRSVECVIAPMLEIRPTGARITDADRYRAAIVTSGNGADGLAVAAPRRMMPVFAVGEATAERARSLGFGPVTAADGTGAALVHLILERLRPDDGPILWASGDEVRVDLARELGKRGFTVDRIVVYRAEPTERLPAAARHALVEGNADRVLFFSPRTAQRFVSLVNEAGLAPQTACVTAHCLSPAVADAARGLPWAGVSIAERPTRHALLATLGDMRTPDLDD